MHTKTNGAVLDRPAKGVMMVDDPAFDSRSIQKPSGDEPYMIDVTITGTKDLLFHRFNDTENSKAQQDDPENCVWRDEDGYIAIPGEYLHGALVKGAKFSPNPRRGGRGSAMDIAKGGIQIATDFARVSSCNGDSVHPNREGWDYIDRRGVVLNGKSRIMRIRPAFLKGWSATFTVIVEAAEYITPDAVYKYITDAGKFVGVGDFRPYRGKFSITQFEVNT